jgi:hypothetical protein
MNVLGTSYTEMAEDSHGKIWIGGYYDILIFNPLTSNFEKSGWYDYAKNKGIIKSELRNSITQSIKRKSDTELWLMTVYGLFSVHTPTHTFTYYPHPKVEDFFAFAIHYIDNSGKLWIGTYDQCFYTFDPNSNRWSHHTCPEKENGISNAVLNICKYDDHTLLFTRLENLYLYDIPSGTFSPLVWNENNDFSSKGSYSKAFVTNDDIFIIKVGSHPVVHLTPKITYIKKTNLPLPKYFVNNHSYIVSNDIVLTSDWDKNLILACNTTSCKTLIDENKSSKLGNLQLTFQSRTGDYFLSTSKNLYKWDGISNKVRKLSPKFSNEQNQNTEFRNFVEDIRGNIYVRERSKGIYVLKKDAGFFTFFNCGIQGENFSAMHYDISTDKLWLASEKKGLFIIDPQTLQVKNYAMSNLVQYNKGYIQDIAGDSQGNLFLLISNRGLITINSHQMIPKLYSTTDGLISDLVKYGCVDHGTYWFSTESGLMAFDYESERFYSFEKEQDGKLFNYRLFTDNKGNISQNLYPNQIITMDRKSILAEKTIANIYLKEIKLSGKIIPIDSLLSVPYHQNNVVLLFGNMGSSELSNKEFQYCINDQSWQALENSTIHLYNLMPGTYRIKVTNKYDKDKVFLSTIEVIPPWWKTTYFYVALLSFILISGYIAYSLRISSVREEEQEKNVLKQRIAEIEMTALRTQMNPHFIFNCLNSINRFILVNDTDAASEYLTKFSRLIRMILDGSRENFTTLEQELEALKLYIEMESMRFLASFEWRIDIAPNVSKETIMIPPLLLQPYVENAIWHGLMQSPSSHAKKLNIQIHQNEDVVMIVIEDNGIGRQKAKEIKSKDGIVHKSHGIALTTERLKLMEKMLGIKTKINIEDIDDSDQNKSGTKVTIFMNN